jgi:hypothetical protein
LPRRELSRLAASLTPRTNSFVPHRPEPPQAAFLLLDCEEAFYGGAAGGGKSDALLMAALQYVDVPGYDALIVRRTYPELSKPGAIMARSHEWLRGTAARWNEQRKTWTFPAGATLSFGFCKLETDVYQYQGAEYDFIGFDELTQFTEWQFTYLFSRLRQQAGAPYPRRMRAASNPGGVGHGWVKRRYITGRAPGVVFVPARLADNPHLDQDGYRRSLSHLPPTTQAQLLNGDWDAFEGMAFPAWDPAVHVVAAFDPPGEWERFESFDHGTSNPSCLLAYAVDYDGNLVVFDSLYGPGLPSSRADAIREKRAAWWPVGVAPVCYADPEMWATTHEKWGSPASDITEYRDLGVEGFVRANNRRSAGRTRVAELLKPDPDRYFPSWHHRHGERGAPRLYVVAQTCPELVDQIAAAPLLPIDSGKEGAGEIVDPGWERAWGHAVASLRYGCMSRPDPSEEPEQPLDDPRAELHRRIVEEEEEGRRRIDRSTHMG